MSRAALKRKIVIFKEMNERDILKPSNIPVPIYLREAEALVEVGKRDWSLLKEIGFSEELLLDLPVRIDALREAESLWRSGSYEMSGARLAWVEGRRQGERVRDRLKAALSFVLRSDREALRTVREAVKGRGAHALVQSLSNLALLGEIYRQELEGINFEPAIIDEVARLSKSLGATLGAADADEARKEAVRLRNAAYTHLYLGLKELREYGLYLFNEDRVKKLDYTSAYLRKKRYNRKKRLGSTAEKSFAPRGERLEERAGGLEKRSECSVKRMDSAGLHRGSPEGDRVKAGSCMYSMEGRTRVPGEQLEEAGRAYELQGIELELSKQGAKPLRKGFRGAERWYLESGKRFAREIVD